LQGPKGDKGYTEEQWLAEPQVEKGDKGDKDLKVNRDH